MKYKTVMYYCATTYIIIAILNIFHLKLFIRLSLLARLFAYTGLYICMYILKYVFILMTYMPWCCSLSGICLLTQVTLWACISTNVLSVVQSIICNLYNIIIWYCLTQFLYFYYYYYLHWYIWKQNSYLNDYMYRMIWNECYSNCIIFILTKYSK